jgi:hypothetical protein
MIKIIDEDILDVDRQDLVIYESDGSLSRCIKINKGIKIIVDEQNMLEIIECQYIKDNFKLGIKRVNRWCYSIYFGEKDRS